MDTKANGALLKQSRVTEWSLEHGGRVPVAFSGLLVLSCATAYAVAVLRGNVDAVLPLISDAAGSPPQNGLFGTLICLGGMCGVVFMLQRYMIVQDKNGDMSGLVALVNKASLVVGICSMLGITLIAGYPINFYRNKDTWLRDVGMPHMAGGVMLLGLGVVYMAMQCVLVLQLKSQLLWPRILLSGIATAAFVYHMVTVPDNFGNISNTNSTYTSMNSTGFLLGLKLEIDTGGSYVASALSQWILVAAIAIFFCTFRQEARDYSLVFVVETHIAASQDILTSDVQTQPIVQAEPPKKRKVLRRDSTCQTMTTPDGEKAPPDDEKCPELDAKLDKLEQLSADEDDERNNKNKEVAQTRDAAN